MTTPLSKNEWKVDDRGYGAYDIFQQANLPGQFNVSELAPGAIRAFHIHNKQTDYVFCPKGNMMVILFELNALGSPVNIQKYVIGEHNPATLVIKPGMAHGYIALHNKPATMCYYVDQKYDNADEGRLAWDMLGKSIWEVKNC